MVKENGQNRPASKPAQKTGSRRVRREADLLPDEKARLDEARARIGKFKAHYECVRDYLRYCDLLVELGLKPAGYQPPVSRVQEETGIPCWRTVKRCMDKARGKVR